MSRLLQTVVVPADLRVLALLPSLRAALSGGGPALLPVGTAGAAPALLRPDTPLADGEDDPDDPTVAVLATSGSTGDPKGALLPASALLASASATHDRLGGPGRWLLALPAHHVAGLQVLVRSLVTGTVPTVLDLGDGFDPGAFAEAAAQVRGPRRYTALVPTQVRRLLDAGGRPLAALAGFDAVLVGGAATTAGLRAEAEAAGVRVVTTYGMSETCGGCVYDGVPLDGVRVELDPPDGRVRLGGPTVARGYRGGHGPADAFTAHDGVRWFRSDDLGTLDGGRLEVLGRADDLVVTGGLKVAPGPVEAALLRLPGVVEAVVVGIEDEEWGQRVVAAVVVRPGEPAPTLVAVRSAVRAEVAAHAAPRQLLVLDRLPLRGPGKPDRAEIARLAAKEAGRPAV
ncbi:MAG TPA: o-succinylbenzoate--CoA ligase [Kineosporiaceae bacterium]|nr:o-succinylbenzoate--CoA ligase [Kineosporiaceae bacterium]